MLVRTDNRNFKLYTAGCYLQAKISCILLLYKDFYYVNTFISFHIFLTAYLTR